MALHVSTTNIMAHHVSTTFEVRGAQYKGAKRRIIKLSFRTGLGAEVRQEVGLIRVRVTGDARDIAVLEAMVPRKLPGCIIRKVDSATYNVPIGVHKVSKTGNFIPSNDLDN